MGHEVDFVFGEMEAVVEVKGGKRVHDGDLRGLDALQESHRTKRALVVSMEKEPQVLDSGIEILPWSLFIEQLWAGQVV